MKPFVGNFCLVSILLLYMFARIQGQSQGIVTFDGYPNWVGTNYVESGMAFQLVVLQGTSLDYMGIVPPRTYQGVPQNTTAFIWWFCQNNPYNYVIFSLTSGGTFGLVSVQLADPIAPSYTNLPISFIGYRIDGSSVTNTFVTPGGGANYFVSYQFSPDFGSGLLSVKIDAPRWAMDNLVWVPEPATWALLVIGVGTLGYVRFRRSKR